MREIHAAHARHPNVAQHQGDVVLAQRVERFDAGARAVGRVVLPGQETLEGVTDRLLIVDHQHR